MQVDYGVIVVSRGGLVEYANARARRWLRDFFGAERTSRLPEPLRTWTALSRGPQATGDRGRIRGRAFTVARNDRRLLVRVIPHGRRRFLLFEDDKLGATGAGSLQLTRRESDVLSWVAVGKTNEEIGAIFGSSPRTVKKHLEHVYSKLGVKTRTAAAAVALAFVSPLPAREWPGEPHASPSTYADRRIDSRRGARYIGRVKQA